ncbi:WD repeat-containing protein 31-like isoform X2 [Babylonia areolata]
MSRPSIHSDAVVSLATIQPGFCLSGSKDKSIVLYDYQNGRVEDRWTGHDREVTKVCYGPSCNGVFSASRDKTIKMWQRGNSHSIRDFMGHELVVTAIHLNTDNTMLCSGSRDNTVRIWDVETGTCLRQNNIPQNLVTDVKWLPGSHLIVQAGEDKEVRIYDSRTMGTVQSFTKKQYIQMCCDVSPDGQWCLTCSNGFGGNGCEATLWRLSDGSIENEFKGHREAIEACLFLPSGQKCSLVATASRDCSVRVWDMYTKECVCEQNFEGTGPLTSMIAYDDGSILVGTFNMGVQVLSLKGCSCLSVVSSF